MDPITASTTFATFVSLVAEFASVRKTRENANVDEFKDWLAEQRHDDIITLLESSDASTAGLKLLLQESHTEIVDRLEQIELLIPSALNQPNSSLSSHQGIIVETIWLDIHNEFTGTDKDLTELATRCAIYVIEGKKIDFNIELLKIDFSPSNDPLEIRRYEMARIARAKQLKARLELLTSQSAHEWWQYYLYKIENWTSAIQGLLWHASFSSSSPAGKKLDVWRTEAPELQTAIYLSELEVKETLNHLGFDQISELSMGAHWRDATELPYHLISHHVIPNIVARLEQHAVPAEGKVLNLAEWHIGLG